MRHTPPPDPDPVLGPGDGRPDGDGDGAEGDGPGVRRAGGVGAGEADGLGDRDPGRRDDDGDGDGPGEAGLPGTAPLAGPLPGSPVLGLCTALWPEPPGSTRRGPDCGGRNRIEKDTSRTYVRATDTMMINGGMKIAGCMRIAASPFRTVVAILSAATARARPSAGRAGPWPIRDALLARRMAAFRCAAVSPGSRKRTVCLPRTSAVRCSPVGRSEYRILITARTSRACQRTGVLMEWKQNVVKLSRSMTFV